MKRNLNIDYICSVEFLLSIQRTYIKIKRKLKYSNCLWSFEIWRKLYSLKRYWPKQSPAISRLIIFILNLIFVRVFSKNWKNKKKTNNNYVPKEILSKGQVRALVKVKFKTYLLFLSWSKSFLSAYYSNKRLSEASKKL